MYNPFSDSSEVRDCELETIIVPLEESESDMNSYSSGNLSSSVLDQDALLYIFNPATFPG